MEFFTFRQGIFTRETFVLRGAIKDNQSEKLNFICHKMSDKITEAVVQRRSEEKVFWKYAANLQENTHAEV